MTRRSSPAARRCFWVSSILSRAASICSPLPPVVASDGWGFPPTSCPMPFPWNWDCFVC